MEEVQLKIDKAGHGYFYILDGEEEVGEMEISISENKLTVFHTEVSPKWEGRGLAKELLAAMVSYARENGLKVIPLCPYVYAQFKHHPETYADVCEEVL